MKTKREQRTYNAELRVVKRDGEQRKIEGHAAVFNQLSDNLGGFREQIKPGAFKKTIKEADVRALFNHDSNIVLGRNKAGTLTLDEDDVGLKVTIDPPDTQAARDLMTSIERGDIDQMSFGFRVIDDSWDVVEEQEIRTLNEVALYDVSPVTFPAYPQTDVGLRHDLQRIEVRMAHGLPIEGDLKAKAIEIYKALKEHLAPLDDEHAEGRDINVVISSANCSTYDLAEVLSRSTTQVQSADDTPVEGDHVPLDVLVLELEREEKLIEEEMKNA